jgi:hypothetical protein
MSVGVTSDPSQPEHPWCWAGLSSSSAEVAVILEEAIEMAGTRHESQSPVLLDPSRSRIKGGMLVYLANRSHNKLAGKLDLPSLLKSKVIWAIFLSEEHL